MSQANPLLMSAKAIWVPDDEPHARNGVHLRVELTPWLGFPLAPLRVYRQNVGAMGASLPTRTDVALVDDRGRLRRFPLTLRQGETVRATFRTGPGRSCIWARVRPARRASEVAARSHHEHGLALSQLNVRALQTLDGATPVQVDLATGAPWIVAAGRIDTLELRGAGVIEGIEWLDSGLVHRPKTLWRELDLPVESAAHYAGKPDALARALDRVRRAAPKALGLHDKPGASGPADASLAMSALQWAAREQARIEAATGSWLAAALQDLLDSHTPWDFHVHQDGPSGGVDVPVEAVALQSTLDSGMARWLGLCDLDSEPGDVGDVVVYWIEGEFPRGYSRILKQFAPDMAVPPLTPGGPVQTLSCIAVATVGVAEPLPVPPKTVLHDPGRWLPGPLGSRRTVTWRVEDSAPSQGLAVARVADGATTRLNSTLPGTHPPRATLLVPSEPSEPGGIALDEAGPRLTDPAAPTGAFTLRLAACDVFGRWGEWADRLVEALKPPGPPQATVQTHIEPGAPATGEGPHPVTLQVQIPRPPAASFAPGALPLQAARLHIERDTPSGTAVMGQPLLPTGPQGVTTSLAVPLTLGEVSEIRVTAWWRDTQGQEGPAGRGSVTAVDPRAPANLPFDPSLRYTSRPDRLGRSRLTLSWTPGAHHAGYRVFLTTESRIRAWSSQGSGRPKAADPSRSAPFRALMLRGVPAPWDLQAGADTSSLERDDLWPRPLWELLTATPVTPGPDGTCSLTLTRSAEEAGLLLVKVVAVGHNGLEADFDTATTIVRAVPVAALPGQPGLERVPPSEPPLESPPSETYVRLRVTLPDGDARPTAWRLRRARRSSAPERMPVAAIGAVPVEGRHFDIVDVGPDLDLDQPLRPWNRYSWVVEVQAGPLPGAAQAGAPLAGSWGQASAPAQGLVLGQEAVGPPRVRVRQLASGVQLRLSHPNADLQPGDVGVWSYDIVRVAPDGRHLATRRVPATAGATFVVEQQAGPSDGFVVRLNDPIGRTTPPAIVSIPT